MKKLFVLSLKMPGVFIRLVIAAGCIALFAPNSGEAVAQGFFLRPNTENQAQVKKQQAKPDTGRSGYFLRPGSNSSAAQRRAHARPDLPVFDMSRMDVKTLETIPPVTLARLGRNPRSLDDVRIFAAARRMPVMRAVQAEHNRTAAAR